LLAGGANLFPSYSKYATTLKIAAAGLMFLTNVASRAFASNTSGKRTAQLTIFYAGAVNVFDDVTQEKVRKVFSCFLTANFLQWNICRMAHIMN
jgi:hypothetical protein